MSVDIPVEYYTPQSRCLCHGRQVSDTSPLRPALGTPKGNKKTHAVWVAWLKYENKEYQPERSMRDYFFLPMNWLSTVMSGSDLFHCQIVFWDAVNRRYYTYSSDHDRGVHVFPKEFAADSWVFVKIMVTEAQELLLQNFLALQLKKPMNTAGQLLLYFGGSAGRGHAWFCSELVAAALEEAGILNFEEWPAFHSPYQVAPHHLLEYLTRFCTTCPVERLPGNPVQISRVYERRRDNPIPLVLGNGIIPQAVADFSTPAASTTSTNNAVRPYYMRHEQSADETDTSTKLSAFVVKQKS